MCKLCLLYCGGTSNYSKIDSHESILCSFFVLLVFTYFGVLKIHVLLSVSCIICDLGLVHRFHFTWCRYRYTHLFIQTPNCTIKSTSLNCKLQKWHKIPQEVGLQVPEIFKQLVWWYMIGQLLIMILVAWEYKRQYSCKFCNSCFVYYTKCQHNTKT